MASTGNRQSAVLTAISRAPRVVEYPREPSGKPKFPSEVFGENVFGFKELAKALPKPVYASFLKQRRGRQSLDRPTADAIAHAVRVWAMSKGATHFTHWFQPQTGATAEKHDAFLGLSIKFTPSGVETHPIDEFSGSQLLQSEPDASSFPSGGMRTTFEARGYTIWDTSSPLFIVEGPHGTSTLYVPSVFISYNGDALDEKTLLLRSSEAVSEAASGLISLIEHNGPGHVYTTLGTEQEFFLVDRAQYVQRPDLKITGRTLVGNLPPRHQQLEDHYFGKIPSRVLAAISEVELECYKLGIPLKTRHNEVAPAQFEVAPVFEESTVAVDHNLLTMDVLSKIAHRHGLKALFHEKPFKGVNGSGKHCNWSLATDQGDNLLDPTARPESNYRFLLFLVAILNGLHKHGALLRAAIASSSNEHRLGAAEAPPGIVSAFLGEQLTEVLDAIEEDRDLKSFSRPEITTIKIGGTVLDVKVSTLPNIARDLTDRNRTSPFAFTGNKFEFRAVGSKQSPSFPVAMLNCAVAESLREISEELVAVRGDKEALTQSEVRAVLRKFIKSSKPIRFEGNNYSAEWVVEAEKRGLPNIRTAPEAFAVLLQPQHKELLTKKVGVLSESELESRYNIMMERYIKDIQVEAGTLESMIRTQVLPAAFTFRKNLADSAAALVAVKKELAAPEISALEELTPIVEAIQTAVSRLSVALVEFEGHDISVEEHAEAANKIIIPLMEQVRQNSDKLETLISDKEWPIPKYSELLLTV